MGSYMPQVPEDREAEGIIPMEPVSMEASSDKISPNMFSVTSTSNWPGFLISCMAVLSTRISLYSTSAYSSASLCMVVRHRREVSNTLALSTEASFLLRFRAVSKATRPIRSISCSE